MDNRLSHGRTSEENNDHLHNMEFYICHVRYYQRFIFHCVVQRREYIIIMYRKTERAVALDWKTI